MAGKRNKFYDARPIHRNRLRVLAAVAIAAVLFSALDSVGTVSLGAPTTVASDTFNRTVSGGWGSADQGGNWTVLDSAANWSVTPGVGSISVPATAQQRAVLSGVSVQDVDLLAKIVLPRCSGSGTNCDAFLLGRVTAGGSPSYYRVGVVQGQGRSTIAIRAQRSDGTALASDLDTRIPAADGAVVWVRTEFQGTNPTTLIARAWLDGTTEPTSWLLNTTDSTAAGQVAGAVGVRARNEDTAASHTFQYRSFLATELAPPPPPPPPPPPTTIAADTFNRTIASGWGNAETGGWWTVAGSPWNWSVSPGAGNVNVGAGGQELAYLSTFTVQDVDILEKVILPRCSGNSSCNAYVLGRYSPAYSPTYYRVGVVQGAGRSHIFLRAQRNDGSNLASDIDTGLPAADGAAVLLRVEFIGVNPTTLRARAWLAGTPEPTTWRLNLTDSTAAEQIAGMTGIRLRNEDTTAGHSFQIQSFNATGSGVPVSITPNPAGAAHLLYVVTDGTVYVYDIDNGHTLVKQFAVPAAGKRGVVVAPGRGLLYIAGCGQVACAGKNGTMVAYDLVHDVVAWIASYAFGIDQGALTPDESSIYMSHGLDATDGIWTILDASNGKPAASIVTGTTDGGHNTIISLDGSQAYLTGHTGTTAKFVHVVNTASNQITLEVGPAVNGLGPFTVNGKHTLAFTTSIQSCVFQVQSLTTGNVLYTLPFSGSCSWPTNDPTHGISISPDETRAYIIDAPLDQLKVYDISGLPSTAPTAVASIPLSSLSGSESPCQSFCQREGWVLNDASGRYVYVGDSGDIISTSTNAVVGNLPPLQNTRQLIEVDWTNGAPTFTTTRFGLGRVIQ